MPGWLPGISCILALFAACDAMSAPKLLYGSVEAEAASEYQAGAGQFGPGFVRLIGRAEVAVTDDLTAKAVVSPCAGPYSPQPQGVTECSLSRLIEEFTLGGVGSNGDFSVGRQIITQGNTEGFVLLDRFNGRDYCRFARLDVQNKLPNWIARGRTFLSESTTFGLTFAPFSANSQLPATGSYCEDKFQDPGQFDYLGDPRNDRLSAWAGGAELAVTRDRWSAVLNVMSTREDIFVLETVPALQKTRPRTLWLGSTASATLGGIVVRGELAFAPGRDFTLGSQALEGIMMQGGATNGIDKRWNLLGVVGVEGRNEDWYWSLQYYRDHVESGPALALNNEAQMSSLRVRRTFMNESIAFDGFSVYDIDYHDLALRATLSYEINEITTVMVGGTGYADFGNVPGLFGSYAGRESLFVKLRTTLF